jgi:hypothetical protein
MTHHYLINFSSKSPISRFGMTQKEDAAFENLKSELKFLNNKTKFMNILSNIPGFFCVFVFDEPDLLLSDAASEVKQRVLYTSSLIPVIDKNLRNRVYTLSQQSSMFKKEDFESFRPPRGYFAVNPGEEAHHFKERILRTCRKSSKFRRFWRRHTDCPIPLDISRAPNLSRFSSHVVRKVLNTVESEDDPDYYSISSVPLNSMMNNSDNSNNNNINLNSNNLFSFFSQSNIFSSFSILPSSCSGSFLDNMNMNNINNPFNMDKCYTNCSLQSNFSASSLSIESGLDSWFFFCFFVLFY